MGKLDCSDPTCNGMGTCPKDSKLHTRTDCFAAYKTDKAHRPREFSTKEECESKFCTSRNGSNKNTIIMYSHLELNVIIWSRQNKAGCALDNRIKIGRYVSDIGQIRMELKTNDMETTGYALVRSIFSTSPKYYKLHEDFTMSVTEILKKGTVVKKHGNSVTVW